VRLLGSVVRIKVFLVVSVLGRKVSWEKKKMEQVSVGLDLVDEAAKSLETK
jgi:hypothetical protein